MANKDVVGDIVEWFHGLAVGVAVTGVYMQLHPGKTWSAFADLLDRHGLGQVRAMERELSLRQGGTQVLPDYARRVDVVFDETWNCLGPHERITLEYASLLPEDDIPKDWLVCLLGSHLKAVEQAADLLAAEATLQRLLGLRLLNQVDDAGTRLGVHRVLRRRVFERLGRGDGTGLARLRLLGDLLLDRAILAHEEPASEEVTARELSTAARTLDVIARMGSPVKALNIAVCLWQRMGERLGR